MQLIILVETKSKDGSDCIYLREFFKKFYGGLRGTKLSFIPMNGKTNYFNKENEIISFKKIYSGESKVIIAIDIDNPELLLDQKTINKNIVNYCKNKGYELVWFNKTIENVFLGKIVKRDKNKIALNYSKNQLINKVRIDSFSKNDFNECRQGESNLKTIIDKLLD